MIIYSNRTWSQPSPFLFTNPSFLRLCLIENMVILVSSDNEQFHADTEVLARSGRLIKAMLESDQPIPLPNVSSSVLKKVLEYCEHHRGEPLPESVANETCKINEWDQKFITVDQKMLFEIILAAQYLGKRVYLHIPRLFGFL